jgi:RNA polymerase sigma-70 factor (ECF subfamily)
VAWSPRTSTGCQERRITPQELNALLARVARGDRAALDLLYARTSAKLYGVVLRIVQRREVADDVLQDVYVRVWGQAGRFAPDKGSAIAWLATIARNIAIDHVRQSKRFVSDEDAGLAERADDARSALDVLEHDDEARRLKTCLDALEPERRALVVAAYFDGASREDLAARAGAPVGTIKTWLHRSLKQLKDCLMS